MHSRKHFSWQGPAAGDHTPRRPTHTWAQPKVALDCRKRIVEWALTGWHGTDTSLSPVTPLSLLINQACHFLFCFSRKHPASCNRKMMHFTPTWFTISKYLPHFGKRTERTLKFPTILITEGDLKTVSLHRFQPPASIFPLIIRKFPGSGKQKSIFDIPSLIHDFQESSSLF